MVAGEHTATIKNPQDFPVPAWYIHAIPIEWLVSSCQKKTHHRSKNRRNTSFKRIGHSKNHSKNPRKTPEKTWKHMERPNVFSIHFSGKNIAQLFLHGSHWCLARAPRPQLQSRGSLGIIAYFKAVKAKYGRMIPSGYVKIAIEHGHL